MLTKTLFFAMAFFSMFRTNSSDSIQANKEKDLERYRISTPRPLDNKKSKIDYYEPYWEKGDWVFNRNGTTSKPGGKILNTGSTQHRECNQLCMKAHEYYGSVCGMRLVKDKGRKGKLVYELKLFEDLCHLELANCVSKTKPYVTSRSLIEDQRQLILLLTTFRHISNS
ncbi:uncharacterized protein LOC126778725 [Nymphalis io]|uniref:uncharacterized protein LOC126778725 n=1 Tax=Inachis io TaxID=171585 RepID=UPI002168D6C8|nr:uncharacterized protein LOC126778725 [Nymphalis io]